MLENFVMLFSGFHGAKIEKDNNGKIIFTCKQHPGNIVGPSSSGAWCIECILPSSAILLESLKKESKNKLG